MRRGLAALLLVFVIGHPAQAAGYDDFAQGVTANVRGEPDQAIAFFTSALKSGDLAPAYVPVAYRGRASAYLDKDRCKEAAEDMTAYAALKPLDRSVYLLRAGIKMCLQDTAGAQQDFDAAMATYPNASLYWQFGRMQWNRGLFTEALPNLQRAAELIEKKRNQHAYYPVLWYAITADRLGKLDLAKLAGFADELSSRDWPQPVVDLLLGKLKPDEVAKKASRGDDADIPGQKCEADFYVGEWFIARNNTEAAKPLIASAMANCPKGFIEYPAALAEGERLGLPPPKEQPK